MIQLSDHFDYKKLILFTVPSVLSVLINSIYGIIDGLFVSNFVGKDPFTALNLIFPFVMILSAVGNMIGVGGTALVAKTMGEGDSRRANGLFSFFVYVCAGVGLLFGVAGIIFLPSISRLLGATDRLLPYCVEYGRIALLGLAPMMLQYTFQGFLIAAEKPKISMYITTASGFIHIALEAVMVIAFDMGLTGAALSTAISMCVGGIIPIFLFRRKDSNWPLRLGKMKVDLMALWLACSNGMSEFLSGISSSVVGILFNLQLLKYAGTDGVAAYGVIMYVDMIFSATSFGYMMGVSPVISYHYGADNKEELHSLVRRSLVIIALSSLSMFLLAEILASPRTLIFTSYDRELTEMTLRGFRIYSFNFIISGFGLFGSSLFTALNNGPLSAVLSFLRLVVYQSGYVLILPLFLGVDGIWITLAVANLFSAVTSLFFIARNRKRYEY